MDNDSPARTGEPLALQLNDQLGLVERLRTFSADSMLSDRYADVMQDAADEIERLRGAVRQLASLNAWHHFGECRAFTAGPILSPHEADELARRVLGA